MTTVRTEDVTAFAEHAEYTGVHATDRAKWLELRRTMITASDVAAILGEDEHRSALDVYVDKITERRGQEVLTLDDPRFWGHVLEQPVLRAVAEYFGWGYRQGGYLLRSRKHPFLGATLDAEVERGDGVWLDFEGKTTRVPRGWNEEDGELPTRVLIQVQSQLLVSGAPLAIVFALLQGSRPCRIEVHPSEDFFAVIVEQGEEFMELVRKLEPPPPAATESARTALHRLHPVEDGSIVDLPPEAVEWTREYFEVCAQIRELERRKLGLQNMLKASIGGATFGLLPEDVGGKACWRWATQRREAYAVSASESRVLLPLKNPPQGAFAGRHPPALAKADRTIEELLEASSLGEDPANVIRIGSGKRRRSRR